MGCYFILHISILNQCFELFTIIKLLIKCMQLNHEYQRTNYPKYESNLTWIVKLCIKILFNSMSMLDISILSWNFTSWLKINTKYIFGEWNKEQWYNKNFIHALKVSCRYVIEIFCNKTHTNDFFIYFK